MGFFVAISGNFGSDFDAVKFDGSMYKVALLHLIVAIR